MLEGTPRNEQGRVGSGGIKWKIINAVLEFAEASGRFKLLRFAPPEVLLHVWFPDKWGVQGMA
ncbi:hypothetical protein PV08_11666 [Exophiala spinifera]|uniref:Uncharacterized protein n=1 Tax=Exophiala spinifera TaxID=91928 RepID=A0A0D1ZCE0_9EURO|nr:uncharacterized protein PV08_11666 [Exophiala spinifera]KIW10702.1 hypothetical protein PV08_11666 [Exophiala spinifera]